MLMLVMMAMMIMISTLGYTIDMHESNDPTPWVVQRYRKLKYPQEKYFISFWWTMKNWYENFKDENKIYKWKNIELYLFSDDITFTYTPLDTWDDENRGQIHISVLLFSVYITIPKSKKTKKELGMGEWDDEGPSYGFAWHIFSSAEYGQELWIYRGLAIKMLSPFWKWDNALSSYLDNDMRWCMIPETRVYSMADGKEKIMIKKKGRSIDCCDVRYDSILYRKTVKFDLTEKDGEERTNMTAVLTATKLQWTWKKPFNILLPWLRLFRARIDIQYTDTGEVGIGSRRHELKYGSDMGTVGESIAYVPGEDPETTFLKFIRSGRDNKFHGKPTLFWWRRKAIK